MLSPSRTVAGVESGELFRVQLFHHAEAAELALGAVEVAMVVQFDTEEFAALSAGDAFSDSDNIDAASHVPPVLYQDLVPHRACIWAATMSPITLPVSLMPRTRGVLPGSLG